VLNQALRENTVREVAGAMVLDGSSVLLKLTEAMVELRRTVGIGGTKRGLEPAVLRETEDAYGIV
jgi:hypothetical protein